MMLRQLIMPGLGFLLSVLFAPGLVAQSAGNPDRAVIEIIEVSHRNPVAVKQQIAGALDPRGSIGVVDNKLIIASTASNFAQLRDLVVAADIPLRRLVVSVDFDHSGAANTSAQQSQQAIEGDVVRFESGTPGAVGLPVPQVQVHTSISDTVAQVAVDVLNVPGFAGRHELQLELGRWYVLNPALDTAEEFEFDPVLDGAQDLPTPAEAAAASDSGVDTSAAANMAPASQALVAPIAVRVDVLP